MNRWYFEKLCKMSQSDLKAHLHTELKKHNGKTYIHDGFIYHRGQFPVLLVAHLDTVHNELPKRFVYKDGKLSSPNGIGGDDRCGVYLIMEILKRFNCSVLFCEDEEVGGIGATKFCKSRFADDLNVNYIIELDRRGNTDACFYDCDNRDFIDFIESTEYFMESYGTFSDISIIAPHCGISAVNLSCGYYNAHTVSEYVVLRDVDTVQKQVCKILCKNCARPFEYIPSKESMKYSRYSAYCDMYDDDDYTDGVYESKSMYYVANKRFTVESYYYGDNEYEVIGRFLKENPYFCYADIYVEYLGEDECII